jgi:hypothetical protein
VIGGGLSGSRLYTAALLLLAATLGQPGAALAADPTMRLADRIIAAEGGPGDNPLSSASGYGQFLRDTWLDVFRRAYPRLALILTGEQILALREVKPLAEQLTDRFAQDNAVALRQLGLPASDATLSLAHAVGAGGAINVLTSAPGRPLRELLSPQAIAANPAFGGMTAEQLRHWATTRVAATAATLANQSPTASREEGAAAPRRAILEMIAPAEDFRVDGRAKASQILTENQATVERLQSFVEAASGAMSATPLAAATAAWTTSVGIDAAALQRGDPAALRSLQQAGKTLVFAAIREAAKRPAFREFAPIARADRPGEPKLAVLRDVAMALAGKMQREDGLLLSIAAHRRGAAAGGAAATRSAERAQP